MAQESNIIIEVSTNGNTWTPLTTLAANSTSYNHTGLTANTLYYYRIKATGDGTTTADSPYATVNATTPSAAAVQLATPSAFSVETTSTGYNFRWNDVANESGYLIQGSADNVTFVNLTTAAANATSAGVTGYTAPTLRYFKLFATGDGVSYTTSNPALHNGELYVPAEENAVFGNFQQTSASGNTVTSDATGTWGSWAGSATATKSLASNVDGYVQGAAPGTVSAFYGVCLDNQQAARAGGQVTSHAHLLWPSSNLYYYLGDGGVTNSGITAMAGDIMRCERIGTRVYYKVARAATPTYFLLVGSKAAANNTVLHPKTLFNAASITLSNVKLMGIS